MIRNIIFDFGKVLVDYDFASAIHPLFNDADKERRFTSIVTSDEFLDRCDMEQDFYFVKLSKPIIDEIDKVLAKHYGFTEEELDFIINYDIKYRMGDELNEE